MGTTSSIAVQRDELRRRRHSSYHRRTWSMEDNIQVLVRASRISREPSPSGD